MFILRLISKFFQILLFYITYIYIYVYFKNMFIIIFG